MAGAPFVNTGFTINVGGSLTCTGTYTVTQADIDNNGGGDGDIDNTVTADSEETGPDTASEDVPIIRNPELNVVKTATGVDADTTPPFSVDAAGDVITYSIVVTNTGNVTLTGVSVNDPLLTNEDCDGVAGHPCQDRLTTTSRIALQSPARHGHPGRHRTRGGDATSTTGPADANEPPGHLHDEVRFPDPSLDVSRRRSPLTTTTRAFPSTRPATSHLLDRRHQHGNVTAPGRP